MSKAQAQPELLSAQPTATDATETWPRCSSCALFRLHIPCSLWPGWPSEPEDLACSDAKIEAFHRARARLVNHLSMSNALARSDGGQT